MSIPKLARGNPFRVSCAITQLSDESPATGLTVTAFIGGSKSATDPIDPALSVTAIERVGDLSTTSRSYDAEFDGDDITTKLSGFDDQDVWVIFIAPDNEYRQERMYQVVSGQGA